MLILGIETSCDETAASVVKDGADILSNIVCSSIRQHKKYGGVIPEIATRHHVENIDRVINLSLEKSGIDINDIDAVSITEGPGLAGSLLVGISCAKAIAFARDVPLIAVDHIKAHIYSALMADIKADVPDFPFIGLVISGGHTRLGIFEDFDTCRILGDTLDDAIGEAYDKVAKILGLGYPGGPAIDSTSKKGNDRAIKFTCRSINNSFDFSFSGIKTAVLYFVNNQGAGNKARIPDIAASFQKAVLAVVISNTVKALQKYRINTLVIGGGVSANSSFREKMFQESKIRNFKLYFPPLDLCSDNAAMVAGLGYRMYKKGIMAGLDMTAIMS